MQLPIKGELMNTKKMVVLGLYATLSLAIYAAESALPPLAPLPGFKLGLANIITLILLRRYTARDAALVLSVRILLSAMLFGQLLSLLYSLAGGVLSLLVMCAVNRLLQKRLLPLTGAMGGLSHNAGQLFAAFLVTSTSGVLAYLPLLIPAGILTGLFTGLCAWMTDRYLPWQIT